MVSRGQPEHLLAADAAAAALFPVGGGSLLGLPAPFLWTLVVWLYCKDVRIVRRQLCDTAVLLH